jgi:DNA-binding transcriptional LysR family regulator
MNLQNVTLRQLRAFVAIADAGSFAGASNRLHLTASALSLLVKSLEGEVGVRLFHRTTRRTELSVAGSELYPLARKLLDDLAHALQSTRDLAQTKRGTVRIACTPLYSAMLMPRLVLGFRERFPAIAVYILDSLNQQALGRVASGEADLGVAPHRPPPPELLHESLLRDRIHLICRPDHALASQRSTTWHAVLREPFVTLTTDFTARLQSDLLRHSPNLVINPVHSVSFLTTALGMVQWGHGVTAQPGRALALLEPYGLVHRPITRPVVHRQVSLYWRRDRELSPAAAGFRDFLREHAASDSHG